MGVNGHWYVEIEKQGYWRGQQKTWVNRYVMSGAQPSAADAQTVITALKNIESSIMPPVPAGQGVGFVNGRAYPSGKGTFYAIETYNPTLAPGTATGYSGSAYPSGSVTRAPTIETCLLVETRLNAMSSTGKPTYLRKYFRGWQGVNEDDDSPNGGLGQGLIAAIAPAVAPWATGVGANNWVVIGNSGAQAAAPPYAGPYLVNHQVPRGKKRKKTSSGGGLLSELSTALQDASAVRNLLGAASEI